MKTKIIFAISTVIFLFTMSACSNNNSTDLQANGVRIAFFPNMTHAQALVGKSNGAFQKSFGEEINIKWMEFNAGPSEIEAMFAGEVDIGYIGPVPSINGYVKSKGDIKIIAAATNGGALLVSRQGLTMTNTSELDGKKVAVPQFGNTQHLILLKLLRDNDLKTVDKGGTVEVVQIANPDIKVLLDRGELDAALVPEPWGSMLLSEVNANIVFDQNQLGNNGDYSTTVVIARTDFIKEHPNIIESFLNAHIELTEFINTNEVEAKTIINEQLELLTQKPLPQNVLNESFTRMEFLYEPPIQSVFDYGDMLKSESFISNFDEKEKIFDTSILNKITK